MTVLVHMASVWVPFTSESKEAVASYPEIQKELRLGLQAVGRKLAMYVRRRQKVKQEGERRQHLPALPGRSGRRPSSEINGIDTQVAVRQLLTVAKRKTAEADVKFDEHGKPIDEEDEEDFGDNVLIVEPETKPAAGIQTAAK